MKRRWSIFVLLLFVALLGASIYDAVPQGQISVVAYGAVGDCTTTGATTGCTDNAAAIQAAIDAAYTHHQTVFFPSRGVASTIYYSSLTINPKGVSLYGSPGLGLRNDGSIYPFVGVRGAPSKDVFALGDPASVGYVTPHTGFVVKDLGVIVDDSVDASASFPHRLLGKSCYDVTATNTSASITTSTAMCNFNQGDVGQNVMLTDGTNILNTTIASVSSAKAAILAAPWTNTTLATAHLYVAVMSETTTATVGNCAWGYDDSSGAGAAGGAVFHISGAVFENSTIATVSGTEQNNSCGFFFQGSTLPYATTFRNLQIRTQFGILGVPSDVAPYAQGWGDLNSFDNIIFNTTIPAVLYGANIMRWNGGQIANATFGPQILGGGSLVEPDPASWIVSNVEFEPAVSGSPAGGWRIEGRDNHLDHVHLAVGISTPAQWDASSSSCDECGSSGLAVTINLTGVLNRLTFIDGVSSDLVVADTGFRNTCSEGRYFNPFDTTQPALFFSCGASTSRQQHAFAHTGDFVANSNELTPYNNQGDLWMWATDFDSASGKASVVVADSDSETGSTNVVPAGGDTYNDLNNQPMLVGPNSTGPSVPATIVHICVRAKSASGTPSATFNFYAPSASLVATVSTTLATTYSTTCYDADLTGLTGDTVRWAFVATPSIDVAWMSIHPNPSYVNIAPPATLISGTAGTARCSMSMQGTLKISTCYLNGYAQTGTADTYTFPTAFSTYPALLVGGSGGATCGTYNPPQPTATVLTLPANGGMTAETCTITAIGQ